MIFAVFDVLLAVNMCINYSFFYIYNKYNTDKQFISHTIFILYIVAVAAV